MAGSRDGTDRKCPQENEQAVIFYFTQRGRQSVIQLAELELAPDGTVTCDRNKYAAAGGPTSQK